MPRSRTIRIPEAIVSTLERAIKDTEFSSCKEFINDAIKKRVEQVKELKFPSKYKT